MRSAVSFHVSVSGGVPAPGSLCAPAAAFAGAWRHRAIGVPAPPGSRREARLEEGLALVHEELRSGRVPLVLLSGLPTAQLELLEVLCAKGLASRLKTALCVAGGDRPLTAALRVPGALVHGLVLDSAPTAAEALLWQRTLGAGIAQRVWLVPPRPAPTIHRVDTAARRDARRRAGLGAAGVVISQVGTRPDSWLALGVQAFEVWAKARYARCRDCGAVSLERFCSETASYEARAACLYCRSPRLRRAASHPSARLAVTLLEESEVSPHPEVVARWLRVEDQVLVRLAREEAPEQALLAALAAADVALVLGHPAFALPWLDAALRAGLPCVTNGSPGGGRALTVASAHYGWDFRGLVTAHPSLGGLVRALDSAAAAARAGAAPAAHGSPGADAAEADGCWADAVVALHDRPRRPRWSARLSPGASGA